MMMPANYSVIAENEMTYVLMTASNWKTFNTNLIKIIGNTFIQPVVDATLGVMFGGNWGNGESLFGKGGEISGFYTGDKTVLNKIMGTLGGLAAVYTLGTGDAKTVHTDSVVKF